MNNNEIYLNENLIRMIVRCMNKAVSEDVPEFIRDNHMETYNCLTHLRGDRINTNLRNMIVNEDIALIEFKRYVWQGRMLVDKKNKITYTITTQNTIRQIPKKLRNTPHFLQTILFIENGSCEAPIKQLSLMNFKTFDEDDLADDYSSIVGDVIKPAEGYRHYVIAYEVEKNELKDIQLEFLDKDFDLIANESLNQYIEPDFAKLTESEPIEENNYGINDSESSRLPRLKPGLRPNLREVEKKA